jgi:hypothetical protein
MILLLLPAFWLNPFESAKSSFRVMVNCVLSGVSQVALGVPTTENMENPSVMSKKKEKKGVFIAD